VGFGNLDIFLREFAAGAALFLGKGADDLGRTAKNHGVGRAGKTLRHQRARADDAAGADHRFIEDDRAHADEAAVLNHAAVQDGGVAHGAIRADAHAHTVGEMHDDVVLDVAAVADDDALDVAAQDGTVEHAGVAAERHVADDGRALGDEHRAGSGGCF
jgi:hypothetical protein